MADSSKPQNDFALDASIPERAAPLESILCTEELQRRPWRPPDYEKENRALVALASAMADPNSNILQTFADTILEGTQCDSAGLSLLTKDGGKRFYWPAIAGAWAPYAGGGTPRNFGPGGDVLDQNCTLLFRHFEQRYPYLQPVTPAAEECLMVPFYVGGKAVGTIWAMMHSDRLRFDAEDERLMNALGQFASLAYQTVESVADLRIQIAAREKAEAQLRERATGLEVRIRRLVDANLMGVFTWSPEGTIVEVNETFLSMVGWGREDVASGSLRWTELTPAEWQARDELALSDLKAKGTVQPYRKEYFRKDGSRVPVLVGAALFESGGDEGVAFVLDLSEQARAEEAFHRVEQQARSIIDSALDAIVVMDADGLITDWSRQAEMIFGWTRPEALGRKMSETIIPMRYRLSHETGLRYFLETGEGPVLNRRIEITALRRDGTEFPVELSVTELKSGDSWTFSGFVRDISERKQAEEKLRQSELNLRQMTETIPEMLWGATPDGVVDYCNARVLDYTGLSQQETKGAGWMKTIHPEDAENVARSWTRSVESGDPFQSEFRCLHAPDGRYRWCVSNALPLRASDGAILRWHGTVVDFHDQRQAQEDLRNAQAELAHVNRVMTMGELTASIAHEVNQPIASIIASGDSCTTWLANEPPNLDKARAAAGRIIQAATQASETVQRIRALFRKTTSVAASVDVNRAIEDTVSLVHHEAERNKIVLRTELEPGVPPVSGDRVQLQQVILNLTMNAIESVARLDHEPRWVLIRSTLSNPGELRVSVEDTGVGIDAEQADRLFAPFFTTKPQGIGMGLPICRSIIEAHGGRLWADRNEPGGAAFRFILPAKVRAE